MALVLLTASVITAYASETKSITISATWEGGYTLAMSKVALTYPTMHWPADNVWYSANEGDESAILNYSVAAGHRVKLAFSSQAWTPTMTDFGPETTIRLKDGGVITPAPAVGQTTDIWTSGGETGVDVVRTFAVQVKSVAAKPGSYTTGLTFILSEVN